MRHRPRPCHWAFGFDCSTSLRLLLLLMLLSSSDADFYLFCFCYYYFYCYNYDPLRMDLLPSPLCCHFSHRVIQKINKGETPRTQVWVSSSSASLPSGQGSSWQKSSFLHLLLQYMCDQDLKRLISSSLLPLLPCCFFSWQHEGAAAASTAAAATAEVLERKSHARYFYFYHLLCTVFFSLSPCFAIKVWIARCKLYLRTVDLLTFFLLFFFSAWSLAILVSRLYIACLSYSRLK